VQRGPAAEGAAADDDNARLRFAGKRLGVEAAREWDRRDALQKRSP
jgi:hypothetical protein